MDKVISLWHSTGIYALVHNYSETGITALGPLLMMFVGLGLLFLAIKKGFEPLKC